MPNIKPDLGRVYVDAAIWPYGRMVMAHMLADNLDALHAMADRIGVARKWFQGPGKARWPHYDICKAKRDLAISYGAIAIDRARFVHLAKALRGDWTPPPPPKIAGDNIPLPPNRPPDRSL